jgi:hypothetical protein
MDKANKFISATLLTLMFIFSALAIENGYYKYASNQIELQYRGELNLIEDTLAHVTDDKIIRQLIIRRKVINGQLVGLNRRSFYVSSYRGYKTYDKD